MKRFMILGTLTIAGGWYLASNLMTPDAHVHKIGWSLPTFGGGPVSGFLGMVTLMSRKPTAMPQAGGAQAVAEVPRQDVSGGRLSSGGGPTAASRKQPGAPRGQQ